MSDPDNNRSLWEDAARKVARKINLAWWLDRLGAPLVVVALVCSCLILVARREMAVFPMTGGAIAGALLLIAVGGLAWWIARRRFEGRKEALVRLETSMKMRNSLTAARHGVAPWPGVPDKVDDGTRWHWPRLLMPLFAAVFFLMASVLLPVSARTDSDSAPPDEPQSWKDIEADIETLSEDDTVQEKYLDELQERLDELRDQDDEEWFSHSSLEATDALEKAHGAEVENFERNMRHAERALDALQKHGDKMSEGARQKLRNEFDEAVQGLNNGAMKPNEELLGKLKELDPDALDNLDPEQLEELKEAMNNAAGKCGKRQGGGQGQGEDWLDELLEEGQEGGGGDGPPGQPQDGPGNQPGKGGVTRGPGTAPGVLGELGGDVKTGDLEGLEGRDLSRSLPGDLLELRDGEHELDKSEVGIRAGGELENEGKGGDRIWKDALLPDEKKALKDFFK